MILRLRFQVWIFCRITTAIYCPESQSTSTQSRNPFLTKMPVAEIPDFVGHLNFPVNKLLAAGDPDIMEKMMEALKKRFHTFLNIYRSEPFFLEIMPKKIDKAYSLQKLLNSIGMTADQMICCGDGYNDVSMIEYAGLGVAMENAQSIVKDTADFITRSNDDDGILHVIEKFMKEK